MFNGNLIEHNDADQQANLLVEHITKACDATMSKKIKENGSGKASILVEIDLLRSECHKTSRRGGVDYMKLRVMFRKKKMQLAEISDKKSKFSSFKGLCDKVRKNLRAKRTHF